MKFEIFHTGSGGNAYTLQFEDGSRLMIEAGKTRFYNAWSDFCRRGESVFDYSGLLVSHEHKDHAGAVSDFRLAGMPMEIKAPQIRVAKVPLEHDVVCNGFIIVNDVTREACVFMIDFRRIINPVDFLCTVKNLQGYKIMFAVELSYCEFLYKLLPMEQRHGLDRHLSDEDFITLFKELKKVTSINNVVTLHASGRELRTKGGASGICPRDYLVSYLKKRLGVFVNIGQDGLKYEF